MSKSPRFSRTGAVVYDDYRDNFVVLPGREAALDDFVKQTYEGQQHKLRHTRSSNSEDALTWSYFDTLRQLPSAARQAALRSLWSLAYAGMEPPPGVVEGTIHIGKCYSDDTEGTEVDASIEGQSVLVFIEAKLYSPISLADEANRKPYDQIARKLRVGVKAAQRAGAAFYFLVLDIAPKEALRRLQPGASLADAKESKQRDFGGKWLTAYWFSRYKGGSSVTPLIEILKDIPKVDAWTVSQNMGWLVWSDVFKVTLRAVVVARNAEPGSVL